MTGGATSALGAIQDLLAHLAEDLEPDTVRQRGWALRELTGFAARLLQVPAETVTVAQALDPAIVSGWLATAQHPEAHDTLRVRGAHDRPAALPSQWARMASVRALGTHAGLDVPDITLPSPTPAPLASEQVLTRLFARLAGPAPGGVRHATWVRFVAVARVIRDTGIGERDLAAMRIEHVNLERRTVLAPDAHGALVPWGIAASTGSALRAWLAARAGAIAHLEGGPVAALWVRVAPASHGSRVAMAGLPISGRGLRMGWAVVMRDVAADLGIEEITMRSLRLSCRARENFSG